MLELFFVKSDFSVGWANFLLVYRFKCCHSVKLYFYVKNPFCNVLFKETEWDRPPVAYQVRLPLNLHVYFFSSFLVGVFFFCFVFEVMSLFYFIGDASGFKCSSICVDKVHGFIVVDNLITGVTKIWCVEEAAA